MGTDLTDMINKRSEYEEHITHEYEMAIRNISKGWDNPDYTKDERMADLQKVSDYQAMREHMSAPTIENGIQSQPGELGYKIPEINASYITKEGMADSYTAVSTVFHENQHNKEEQAEYGVKGVAEQFTKEQIDAFQKEYTQAQNDYEAYYNHPKEVDARNAEQSWMMQYGQDVDAIQMADKDLHFQGNQILETYGYPALQYADITQEDYNWNLYNEEYSNLTDIVANGEMENIDGQQEIGDNMGYSIEDADIEDVNNIGDSMDYDIAE